MIYFLLYILILRFLYSQSENICQNDHFNVSRVNTSYTSGFKNYWVKNYSNSALYKASITNSCQWVAQFPDGTNKTVSYTMNAVHNPDDDDIFGTRDEKNTGGVFNYGKPNKKHRKNITLYFSCENFLNVSCSIEVKFVKKLPEKSCDRKPNLIGKGFFFPNKDKFDPNENINVTCENGYKITGNSSSFCKNGIFLPKNLSCTANGIIEKETTELYLYIIISGCTVIIALLIFFVFIKNKNYCSSRALRKQEEEVNLSSEEVNNPIYRTSIETKNPEKLEKENPIYNIDEKDTEKLEKQNPIYNLDEKDVRTIKGVVEETYAVIQKKSTKKTL